MSCRSLIKSEGVRRYGALGVLTVASILGILGWMLWSQVQAGGWNKPGNHLIVHGDSTCTLIIREAQGNVPVHTWVGCHFVARFRAPVEIRISTGSCAGVRFASNFASTGPLYDIQECINCKTLQADHPCLKETFPPSIHSRLRHWDIHRAPVTHVWPFPWTRPEPPFESASPPVSLESLHDNAHEADQALPKDGEV